MNKLVSIEMQNKTLIGDLVSREGNVVKLKNPATLFIQPTNNGQLSVQVFPMFFQDLLTTSSRDKGTEWEFDLTGNGYADSLELDERLVEQYNRIFNPSKIITPPDSGKVIKLFDD